jgi:tetratricopeptide (TPR) repeat protein
MIGGIAAVVIIAVAIAAALWLRPGSAGNTPVPPSGLDPEKVVVAVFDNRTGDATLDSLGIMASDVVTQALRRLEGVKVAENPMVASSSLALPRVAMPPGTDPLRWVVERTGAGLAVTGALYLDGSNIRAQSRIVDTASGKPVVDIDAVTGPRATPSAVVDALAQRVLGAVATRFNRFVFTMLGTSGQRAPKYDAYLEFLSGVKTFPFDLSAAVARFQSAMALDPEFVSARIFTAGAFSSQGLRIKADEVLRTCEEPAFISKATPFEQALIRYLRAGLEGNLTGQNAAAREVARLQLAGGAWWYNVAISEANLHRPRAAIEAINQIVQPTNSDLAQATYAQTYWPANLAANNHHEIGEYARQLELAQQGYRENPNDGVFFEHEAAALIALGRLSGLEDVIARCQKASLRTGSVGAVLWRATRELAAHGQRDAAAAMAVRAAAWYKARLETVKKSTPSLRAAYANNLWLAGNCAEGLPIRRELAQGEPDNLPYQSSYATMLVTCGGSRAEALKIAEALAKVDRPFLNGEHHYQRARVLALLGDREGSMRALNAAFAQGRSWNGTEMHLDTAWDPLRDYPPFIELMKPRG